jgi:hypothetical protein
VGFSAGSGALAMTARLVVAFLLGMIVGGAIFASGTAIATRLNAPPPRHTGL